MVLITLLCVTFVFLYFIGKKKYSYWKNLGVRQTSPVYFLGDFTKLFFKIVNLAELTQSIYNTAHGRYVGFYLFTKPILMIKDVELIKQICVKDFDHFTDHKIFVQDESDPLWGQNLFSLKGKKWHEMRTTLSPAFTNIKMKQMFNLINDCASRFTNFFYKKSHNTINVELKDIFTRYTTDVIGSAAFGVTCDSLKEPKNEFYVMGKKATDFESFYKVIKFFAYSIMPKFFKFFGISLLSDEVATFFKKLIKKSIEVREKEGIIRPDMIHLLLETRKGNLKYEEDSNLDGGFSVINEDEMGKKTNLKKKNITDDDIAAQALIFFFAGYETVATTCCFMAYELAVNSEIQDKLRHEIDELSKVYPDNISYENIMKMKYMDMVLTETLRKWTPSVTIDRKCVKPYTIQSIEPNEKPVTIKQGDSIWIPQYSIQHDPAYYPNPEIFDPDRFSDENKSSIHPYAFLPFGAGPRSCIGNRFALLEIKVLFFNLLSKFELKVTDKTQVPLVLGKQHLNLCPEKGFWIGLKARCDI